MNLSAKRCGVGAILLFSLVSAGALWAQVDKATVSGTATDDSGAVVPGVRVTVRNVATGVNYAGTTNEVGMYRIPGLPIGTYSLEYEKEGFKKLTRSGLSLETGQVAEINVKMTLGTVTEVVEVTAEPVMLETATTSVGTLMTAQSMRDLPLDINSSGVGRDVTSFIYASVATATGGNWVGHIGGSQDMTKNVMVDGVDATAGLQGFIQNVGMEAVQEMDVQISGTTAEGASTGGGTILFEMKSGTNQLHGSSYYFLQNEALNANSWDNNFYGSQCTSASCRDTFRRPRNRFDDWGFSAGGPIWKNHTFIFGSYERFHNVEKVFASNQATVPTNAFLNGDFSALLGGPLMVDGQQATDACGRAVYTGEIYDPRNPVVSGGNTCYQPFSGNIIPQNRLSPIAVSIADNLYRKGYAPTGPGILNNYQAFSGTPGVVSEHLDLKLDHNLSSKQRIAAAYNWWHYEYLGSGGLWQTGSSDGGPLGTGDTQPQRDWSLRLQHFYNLLPTLLNTLSFAYNEHRAEDNPPSVYDASTVGILGTNGKGFPMINFSGEPNGISETNVGPPYSDRYAMYNYVISDTVSWMHGRHSFKFGGDFQARGVNGSYDGGVRSYNFTNTTFAPNDPTIQPYVGFAFANFMLGEVHDGFQSAGSALYGRRKRMSLFASDDIKLTPRLTINLGLRWDMNRRFHEKNGHLANFDLTANNPNWGAYPGAWTWPDNSGGSFEKNQNFHQFGPQLGVAYKAMSNLVLRGHYGITYSPLALNQWNGVPFVYPSSGITGGSFGFIGSNNVVNPSVQSSAFNWDTAPGTYPVQDVYPERVPGQTDVRGGVAYTWPDALTMGMVQNWSLGAQYLLGKGTVIALSYLGNHGSHLHDGNVWPYNFSTRDVYLKLLNSGHANDIVTDAASAAAAGVPYPYMGFSGYAYMAIVPFPQVVSQSPIPGIALNNADLSMSAYRALVAEVRTKDVHGLTADLNYTLSRSEGTASSAGAYVDAWSGTLFTQDPYSLSRLTDQVTPWNHTHEVKGYVVYDLPFGSGKKWRRGKEWLDNYLLGGWTLGVQLSYHSGEPLRTIASGVRYPGWSGVFAQRDPSVSLANKFKTLNLDWVANPTPGGDSSSLFFNPNAFANPAFGTFTSEQYAYMQNLQNWAYCDEDLSVVKRFRFGAGERYLFSLRAQFFDVFNRHHWGSPSRNINSVYFGHVTSVSGFRYGQAGLRFEW